MPRLFAVEFKDRPVTKYIKPETKFIVLASTSIISPVLPLFMTDFVYNGINGPNLWPIVLFAPPIAFLYNFIVFIILYKKDSVSKVISGIGLVLSVLFLLHLLWPLL